MILVPIFRPRKHALPPIAFHFQLKNRLKYIQISWKLTQVFKNYQRIICISRRPLIENFMKVQSIVISDVTKFEPEIKIGVKIDVAFCCIGTSLSDVSKVIIFFFSPMFSSRLILKRMSLNLWKKKYPFLQQKHCGKLAAKTFISCRGLHHIPILFSLCQESKDSASLH